MLNFPVIRERNEPSAEKMSLMDYAHFCLFCLENNPQLTSDDGLRRKSGEKKIAEPFRLRSLTPAS